MSMLPLTNLPSQTIPAYKTWKIDFQQNRLTSFIDEGDALQQAILLRLSISRYQHNIYSFLYGSTLYELVGKDYETIVTRAPSIIKEILSHEARITSVEDFQFQKEKGNVLISFTVIWNGENMTIKTTI